MHRTWTLLLLAGLIAACSPESAVELSAQAQKGSGKDGKQDKNPFSLAHAPAEVLVEFFFPDDATAVTAVADSVGALEVERVGATAFFRVVLPATADLAATIETIEDDLRVVRAELNFIGEAPEGGPTKLPVLGGDILSIRVQQPALAKLAIPAAQDFSTGAGVVVAVVDTGVDASHPLLADVIVVGGFDFVDLDGDPTDVRSGTDSDADGLVDEQYGHGTFVASLIHIIAPDAGILPVRTLDADGLGTTARVAAGITWAVDQGADVINVSIDVPGDARVVKAAVQYAEINDVLIVAAAGNDGREDIVFPAQYGDVVGVAASDDSGVVADFSNVGKRLTVVAPGVDLIGAYPLDASTTGTALWSGTSFASPVVAGTAALVRARFPLLTEAMVEQRLADTALDVAGVNPGPLKDLIGDGLVQPLAAVR